MASLAELLDYDNKKKQALEALQTSLNKGYGLADAFTRGLSDQVGGVVELVTTDPRETIGNLYKGVKNVVQHPKEAYQAAKEGISEAISSPENIARFAGQNFSPTEIANALNKVGTMRELTVYHGTPHKFENFDASKVGTGTGEQAYGHGIYLTEDPEVAKSYKLSTSKKTPATDEHISTDVEYYPGEDLQGHAADRAVSHVFRRGKHEYTFSDGSIGEFDSSGNYTAHGPSEGHFLTVDLPDEKINLMLDWNKPLKEQKSVMSKLEKHWEEKFGDPDIVKQQLGLDKNSIGSDLAMALGIGKHPEISKTSSMMMQSLGIPGIKYRSYDRLPKKGESFNPKHNYVVFPGEEKNLKIFNRE